MSFGTTLALADEPFFVGLGGLAGGDFESRAWGVSDDGAVVVGDSVVAGLFGTQAFVWTREEGMRPLGALEPGLRSRADGASVDGNTIVGWVGDSNQGQAVMWVNRSEFRLGDLPGGLFASAAHSVSDNGLIVVGVATSAEPRFFEPFRWTAEDGMVSLGPLPGAELHGMARAVSADGSVIVGGARPPVGVGPAEAFRWTEDTGMVGLGDLPGGAFNSIAYDVSADGRVIVGIATAADQTQAFRWTEQEGMTELDPQRRFFQPRAWSVSGDGSLIVGDGLKRVTDREYRSFSFIWDKHHGMRDLSAVLSEQYGLDLSGWTLTTATAVTPDGRTIVGFGQSPRPEAWIAHLGPPPDCTGDIDGDHAVTLSDLGVLLSHFGSTDGEPTPGDLDNDGDVDLDDLQTLLQNFGSICIG